MNHDLEEIRKNLKAVPTKVVATIEGDLRKISDLIYELADKNYNSREIVAKVREAGFKAKESSMVAPVRAILNERESTKSDPSKDDKKKKTTPASGAAKSARNVAGSAPGTHTVAADATKVAKDGNVDTEQSHMDRSDRAAAHHPSDREVDDQDGQQAEELESVSYNVGEGNAGLMGRAMKRSSPGESDDNAEDTATKRVRAAIPGKRR